MTADDLARLAMAKRAFQATQPSEREIQTGVRRARLSLERRRPRRNWFGKGVVMVILAAGGLAYAKPQALSEIVARMMPASATDHRGGTAAGAEPVSPAESTALTGSALNQGVARADAPAPAAEERLADAQSDAHTTSPAPKGRASLALGVDAVDPRPSDPAPASRSKRAEKAATDSKHSDDGAERANRLSSLEVDGDSASQPAASSSQELTDWGRVGQALAHGDERTALSALGDLSESDDPRTRDKADLGRAQLLMAHGDSVKACAIARSLTHRRAGGRIERQAQILLKSCR